MAKNDIKKPLRKIPFNPSVGSGMNTDLFAARLFLLKRIAFAYEDEIRIIIIKDKASKESGIQFHYDCANTDIIRRIVLDPRIGDYTYKMLRKLFVNTYGFSSLKENGEEYNRVLRSQIYSRPKPVTLKLD